MDLFESSISSESEPLASRMRPRTLDEYVGQEHILGKGRLLRRAIQLDQLSSIIFYGPPGTGKTTLAKVIANTTKSHFSTLNAVLAGLKELEVEINAAKERRSLHGIKTILFIDEVHRWNKRQQDALLPWVENGTVILIGATTENPYFEVNAALVSRSRIFQLKKLEKKDLEKIAIQALTDKERGYGRFKVSFEEGALEHLVDTVLIIDGNNEDELRSIMATKNRFGTARRSRVLAVPGRESARRCGRAEGLCRPLCTYPSTWPPKPASRRGRGAFCQASVQAGR